MTVDKSFLHFGHDYQILPMALMRSLLIKIESRKGHADNLSCQDDRELYMKMLNDSYKYATAVNAIVESFPSEPLIMALLLAQHKMIDWLTLKISNIRFLSNTNQ